MSLSPHLTNLLYNSARIGVPGQLQHMPLHCFGQLSLLQLRSKLEELLANIITENVHHKLFGVWKNFCKYEILLVALSCLQSFLDEPGAILITGNLCYKCANVLK